MSKIAPCIRFDQKAMEAVGFYTKFFENNSIDTVSHYFEELFPDGFEGEILPSGSVLSVGFKICDQEFFAINAGPGPRPNPSISFFVACKYAEEVDALWTELMMGGTALMELDELPPFSRRFGWLEDKYGISWQIALMDNQENLNLISPYLMFCGENNGRAKEAIDLYCNTFEDSSIDVLVPHGPDDEGGDEGTVLHGEFRLAGQSFVAMDSKLPHPFAFDQGISFMVFCKDQEEIDRIWEKLSEQGEEQSCGWLKDRFGVSWQIVPEELGRLTDTFDLARSTKVWHAMLQMKKIDLQTLLDAYGEDLQV